MTKLADVRKWNQPYDVPDPTALSTYQRDIYSSFGKPIFSTKPEEWEQLAKEKVPAENFGYVYGSASSFKTYKAVRSVPHAIGIVLRKQILTNCNLTRETDHIAESGGFRSVSSTTSHAGQCH